MSSLHSLCFVGIVLLAQLVARHSRLLLQISLAAVHAPQYFVSWQVFFPHLP